MKTYQNLIRLLLMLWSLSAMASEDWTLNISTFNETVIDQTGKTHRFYEDLIKNKTVAINFIFTACTSSCTLSTAIFRQVQKKMGKHKIKLISISVDPSNDTPEELQKFSKKFKAESGWTFLTGDKTVISQLLKNLDVYSADKNQHSNTVIVGNDAKQQWTRLYGFPQANDIITALKNMSQVSKKN